MKEKSERTCVNCGVVNCTDLRKEFPDFCLTSKYEVDNQEVLKIYTEDEETGKLAIAAAEIEGQYYGKLTRVEEIVMFCKKIGAKRIGVVTCVGLINEARIFARVLEAKGLTPVGVACKVGANDKPSIGIDPEYKIRKGCHESMCNPVLQAKIMNAEKTDFNVIVGLCVGHDTLFIKYSDAPVTTLITKDRVLAHNPAAGLYLSQSYYKRLLKEED